MKIFLYIFFLFISLKAFSQGEYSNEQVIEISDYIFQLEKKDSTFISGMQSIHTRDLDSILDPYKKFKRLLANYDTLYNKYVKLDSAFTALSKQKNIPKPDLTSLTKKDTSAKIITQENKNLPIVKRDSTYLKEPIYKTISFEVNTSILNKKYHPELDELIKILKKDQKQKVHLEGNACGTGDLTLNEVISAQRAMVIKNYLIKNEIKLSRIISTNIVHDETNIPDQERYKYRTCHIRLVR
jgi:outer membrane protein OmpA-like peptidoglycan-associated protein